MDNITKDRSARFRETETAREALTSENTDTSSFGRTVTATEQTSHDQPSTTEPPSGSSVTERAVSGVPPEFPTGSGARRKTTAAKPNKQREKKKQIEKTTTPTPKKSDARCSMKIKGMTQQIIRAGSNELQVFNNEVKELYRQISKKNWSQINKIQNNMDRFLPELERLGRDYELFTRSYPASSSDKKFFERAGGTGDVISILFAYKQRSEAALMLGRIAQCMMAHMEQFLLPHEQNHRFIDRLLDPILRTAGLWLRWVIESRINDQQAIDDQHGEGLPIDEEMTSINLGQLYSLQESWCEPRCSEAIVNGAFYKVISWLATGHLFHQKHQIVGQSTKPECLDISQQLLTQSLQQYRDHRRFRNYEPEPGTENFLETQLNYAEQLIFCVHAQRWDLAQRTLQRLSSMVSSRESSTGEGQKKAEREELTKACLQSIDPQEWHQECDNRRLYALYDYLFMCLNAGHQCFNHFYQQRISGSAAQGYSLNIEQLQFLLARFREWADLITTPEQTVAPSYLEAQQQLEENSRQLEQLHQDNLKFLAQYFQEQVARPPTRRPTGVVVLHTEADSSDASSDASAPTMMVQVQPDNEATDIAGAVEQSEYQGESSDEGAGWQQVKPRRRRMSTETALNSLSKALGDQNTKDAITVLKSTDAHDALRQLQASSSALEALPVNILVPLVSGYSQVRELSRHIKQGESLIPNIRPFVVSLLDEDALTSMDITRRFTAAIEEFSDSDIAAQQALNAISEAVNTLLDLQAEEDEPDHVAIMAACDVLITSTHNLKERLVNLREGIINAWKKRYELLLRHYPERLKAKKSKTKVADTALKTLFTNNAAFKKCSSDFEKCQNIHQEKQRSLLPTEQSEGPTRLSPEQASVRQDINEVLNVFGLSPDQAPSIIALGRRIDFMAKITRNMPDDEMAYRIALVCIAQHLDIEISTMHMASNMSHEIERNPERPPSEQRPALPKYLTHSSAPRIEGERIRALRDYFHMKIPDILADLNADQTGMPVVLTGSMAFQRQVLSLWDNAADSPLSLLYEQTTQNLPTGITHDHMQACMTPRDTDLFILNHCQFDNILERLNIALKHTRSGHKELHNAAGSVVARGREQVTYFGRTCTTDRLVVTGTEPFPNNIHYVVDMSMGSYPDNPSPDHYTTIAHGNSRIHMRRMDDIILDELSSIQTMFAGEERARKAITRLFMIAFLECQQPKLDAISRMALLHALDSLPGEDPVITALAEQLRQRPFYIVCHEGRFQGAQRVELDQPATSATSARD